MTVILISGMRRLLWPSSFCLTQHSQILCWWPPKHGRVSENLGKLMSLDLVAQRLAPYSVRSFLSMELLTISSVIPPCFRLLTVSWLILFLNTFAVRLLIAASASPRRAIQLSLKFVFTSPLFWCLIYMWSVVTFWLWMVSCWFRDRLGLCSDTVLDCDPFLWFVCNNASDESFYGHLALLWCCDACFCLVLLICRRLTGYVMLNLSETFIGVVVHYWCLPDQDVVILLWLVLKTLLKRLKL